MQNCGSTPSAPPDAWPGIESSDDEPTGRLPPLAHDQRFCLAAMLLFGLWQGQWFILRGSKVHCRYA